jgi:UDP-2,3-diacylglucosamine hydrolase
MQSDVQRIGILAGGGSLPREIARQAQAAGYHVHIVGLDGEITDDFDGISVETVNWGAIGRMVTSFKEAGIHDIIIVGAVNRPNFARIRPDLGFFKSLPKIYRIIKAGGDDSVLRHVVTFFEQQGFRVVGPQAVAPNLIVSEGPLGRKSATDAERNDIAIGFDIVRRLGRFDVGQGVVVNRGIIEAIEGAEGTDRMLERVALMRVRQNHTSGSGVLVKRPKPNQEMRVDMPTVGPKTATLAGRAGLSGVALLRDATIAAERSSLIETADDSDLFIEGFSDDQSAPSSQAEFEGDISFVQLGNVKLSHGELLDLRKGIGVLEALAPYGVGSAVAVARRHVLAIEVGEGNEAFLERVKTLSQWKRGSRHNAVGIGVFGNAKPFGVGLVERAYQAGLKGVMIASDGLEKAEWPVAIVNADKRKMFIGALTVSEDAKA